MLPPTAIKTPPQDRKKDPFRRLVMMVLEEMTLPVPWKILSLRQLENVLCHQFN